MIGKISGKIKNWILENKYYLVGFLLVVIYLFSKCIFEDYIISFTNITYDKAPFDTLNVETDGPWLSDIADSDFPLKYQVFYDEEEVSLWNSDIALGTSENSVAEILYPGNIAYLFPAEFAVGFKVFLEFFVGFVSMFLFMRSIGVNKFAASVAGITYTFSGAIVVWMGWPHSDVAALAPLLFYGVEKLLSTLKVKYMLLLTLVIYTMLMATMPTYVAYFMYLAGVYIVVYTCIRYWKNKKNILKVGVMFAFSVILAVIMSMPYTITLVTQVVGNGYADSRTGYAEAKLGWEYLRTFLLPYMRDGMQSHANESTMFVGSLPLVLLPLMFVNNKKKKRNTFFAASSVVVLLLIFTDVLNGIFLKMPAINTSLKYRVIALLMFTLAALAGITLNDIMVNGRDYMAKKWLIAIQAIWVLFILNFTMQAVTDYYQGLNIDLDVIAELKNRINLTLLILVVVIVLIWKNWKVARIALAILVTVDCAGFAKEYLPMISEDATIIPDATESVEYLVESTENEERIVGIGSWIFFPNTPSIYGLNDIRLHGFVSTNQDMINYYQAIAEDCYDTYTRVTFTEIENYELLKYIGVKNVYADILGNIVELASINSERSPYGGISSNTTFSQTIDVENGFSGFQILCATYGHEAAGEDNLVFSIYDAESGEKVVTQRISTRDIKDNEYLNISFYEEPLPEGQYVVELAFEDVGADTLTLWCGQEYEYRMLVNGVATERNFIMNAVYTVDDYKVVHVGDDGVYVGEMNEYADKAELVETIVVEEDEEAVLAAMKEDYLDNTIFVTEAQGIDAYNIPLTEDETIELVEYEDSYIKIQCTTVAERYVAVNDYYADGWNAYVNGEKVEIEKVNYLTRAVKVPAGEDNVVEMKYEPTDMKMYLICFGVGTIIFCILFLCRNKLQKCCETK